MDWRQQVGRFVPENLKQSRRAWVVREFSRLFYDGGVWWDITWFGVPVLKSPGDLWVYQEILHEVRPDLIVETGTWNGGSALYLASICDLLGTGAVMTIDPAERPGRPEHPRIEYVHARSTDPSAIASVTARASGRSTMVILDSDHERGNVLAELEAYAGLVTPSSYLIVEDTSVNGHPIHASFGPGPWEALDEWLPGHPEFEVDVGREKLLHTFNPRGYLRRV